MRFDRPVREVEPLPDLTVGQPLGGHLHDLKFLRGELLQRVRRFLLARLAGGPEFLPGGVHA